MVDLEQIIEKEPGRLRRWVRFEAGASGFDVEIEHIAKQTLESIRRKAMKIKWRGHVREEELDDTRFYISLGKQIINWRGLDTDVLKQIFPLKADVNLNGAEIECTDKNKLFMLSSAYGFDDFIFRCLTELQDIETEQRETELKNSDALSQQD